MNRRISTLIAILLPVLASAQFVNNGGIITVQNGGKIYCNGSFQNNTGTIVNNGQIEVLGNFQNSARYTSGTTAAAAEDSLIVSGGVNSTISTGTDTIAFLWIKKTTAASEAKILGTVKVGRKLIYDQGTVTTDPVANPTYMLSAPATAAFTFATGKEIIGKVQRTGWAHSGTATIFHQPNMTISTSGGTAPSEISAMMIPQSAGGDPLQTQREVKRKFVFSRTGGAGYTAAVRFPYINSELNTNKEGNLAPWAFEPGEWTAKLTPITFDSVQNYVSITGVDSTNFAKEWKLADPVYTVNANVNLRGAWNGTSMNTTLFSSSLIPLAQPYNYSPISYTGTESVTSVPANVVDWIMVELRRPYSHVPSDAISATIIGRKAGFLLSNGNIVNTDGVTPISFPIYKQDSSFVVIKHRNHLGVMSKLLPSNTAGSFTNDFSQIANIHLPAGASSNPEVLLSGTTGKYGMWAGDASKNNAVAINDVNLIKIASTSSQSGYLFQDVNMNGAVNISDVNLAKTTISSSGSGNTFRPVPAESNVPE